MKSGDQISYFSQMGYLFGSLVVSFLLFNLVSAALIWSMRWGLTTLLGWSPFTLNGIEILLGAVFLHVLLKQFVKEMAT